MTRINTNVPSLVAQNRLQRSNADLQTRLTRLSTGLRINRGADDPAGLIASEALRSEITSLNKALSNTRRADQIIATADSALSQVSNLLNDVRGLVVEAANTGALSEDEIAANQLQIDSSLEAINRIAQTTTFQGRKLLDGSLDFLTQGGSNINKISNLKIDQANLGAAGSIDVDVQITNEASQASIAIDNIPTGSTGTGTITLNNLSPDGEAETQALATGGGGAYTVSAKDGGAFDGTAGNAVTVNIQAGETTALTQASSGVLSTAAGGDFNISVKSSSQYRGHYGNDIDVVVQAGNTATAQAVSAAQDVNGVTGAFQIRAKAGGDFDGVRGNSFTFSVVSANALAADAVATVDTGANTLAIEVDDANSLTLADIKAALEADANFQDDFEFVIADGNENVLFRADGSDDIAGPVDLDGDTAGTDAAATVEFDGSVLTITVDDNTDRNLSAIKTALEASTTFTTDFEFNLGVDGAFENDGTDDIAATSFSGGTNAVAEAELDGNTLNITVTDGTAATLNQIATALADQADFDDFEFNVTTSALFAVDGTDDVTDENLGSGTAGTDATLADAITVTAPAGANRNGNITITQAAGVTTPTASVDENGNITIQVSDTATTALSAIVSSINNLDGYEAELTTNAGDAVFDPTNDTISGSAITGAEAGGLDADVVFELSGRTGSEVFNVSAGTTIDQLVDQINLVSDSTGITAAADSGTLTLTSSQYGSAEFVDISVISEGTGGNFTPEVGSGLRSSGTDVTAKVNGVDANVDGNKISINTATLDLSLEIEAGFEGTASFSITGGGALFQLGPDVVSNQQARIGIGSVSTSRLGGASGRLFELGSGESASLSNDAGRAAEIVNEAITRVTSLRGRLGAFQRTTLDSNLASISDTVANLQEAESSIRDADFAAESAALTRAQILVQSGTNVLALANQNPQNVLSLLR